MAYIKNNRKKDLQEGDVDFSASDVISFYVIIRHVQKQKPLYLVCYLQ